MANPQKPAIRAQHGPDWHLHFIDQHGLPFQCILEGSRSQEAVGVRWWLP